jgi:hypothetical protein
MPDRLRVRFLERCAECTSTDQQEVQAALAEYFLARLEAGTLKSLNTRKASRIFQRWAEFDPVSGLRWLRRAVEDAPAEELLGLDGDPDGSGGWRGRRQLVWLCEHLACFPEHFADCEAILFRFARHETEPEIGNNSSAIWRNLYWTALANTAVPFPDRLPTLLDRLRRATAEELPLVLGAVVEMMTDHPAGPILPPPIVGGRLVPSMWLPRTWQQDRRLKHDAGHGVLAIIRDLPPVLCRDALALLTPHLAAFVGAGLTPELRAIFSGERLTPDLRRRIVGELDQQISHLEWQVSEQLEWQPRDRQPADEERLAALRDWRSDLSGMDLPTRIQDLTAQDYWLSRRPTEQNRPYDTLAVEVLTDPTSLLNLAEWFSNAAAKSGWQLAHTLGRVDSQTRLLTVVRDWLVGGVAEPFVAGYLAGTAAREGRLPDAWAAELDAASASHPDYVARITVQVDVGDRGFARVMDLLSRLSEPRSPILRGFTFGGWSAVLTLGRLAQVLQALVHLAESGDQLATGIGFEILWLHGRDQSSPLPSEFVPAALALAGRVVDHGDAVDHYRWGRVMSRLALAEPAQVARLLATVLTAVSPDQVRYQRPTLEALLRVAPLAPQSVMDALGEAMIDPTRRQLFELLVFRGLFEAIGVVVVRDWVVRHGREHLRSIARHLPSPILDESGAVVIPPITEWFFTECGTDDGLFRYYLIGRNNFVARYRGEINLADLQSRMEPYLRHPHPRVRQWAEAELQEQRWMADHDQRMDEEMERV